MNCAADPGQYTSRHWGVDFPPSLYTFHSTNGFILNRSLPFQDTNRSWFLSSLWQHRSYRSNMLFPHLASLSLAFRPIKQQKVRFPFSTSLVSILECHLGTYCACNTVRRVKSSIINCLIWRLDKFRSRSNCSYYAPSRNYSTER